VVGVTSAAGTICGTRLVEVSADSSVLHRPKHFRYLLRGIVNRLTEAVSSVQSNLTSRRESRLAHRQLVREVLDLASTPSGRLELDSILSRHTPEETRELESILTGRAA
jgi:hypothetical protein